MSLGLNLFYYNMTTCEVLQMIMDKCVHNVPKIWTPNRVMIPCIDIMVLINSINITVTLSLVNKKLNQHFKHKYEHKALINGIILTFNLFTQPLMSCIDTRLLKQLPCRIPSLEKSQMGTFSSYLPVGHHKNKYNQMVSSITWIYDTPILIIRNSRWVLIHS